MMSYIRYYRGIEKHYTEYCKENFPGNNNMYVFLSDKQMEIIKKYSRLRTKEVFNTLSSMHARLAVKPEKALKLYNLMQGLDDWVYDGTVDTGWVGGGHCELGHALRYEHWAVSESTGRELVFGSTCAGDFFGITEATLKAIDGARETVLEEIKFVLYLIYSGNDVSYEEEVYGDLESMCSIPEVKEQFRSILGDYGPIFTAMMNNGIPLTKSMVERVEKLRAWFENTYRAKLKQEEIKKRLAGISNEYVLHFESIMNNTNVERSGNIALAINSSIRNSCNMRATCDNESIVASVILSKHLEDNIDSVLAFTRLMKADIFTKKMKSYTVSNGKFKRLATEREVTEKLIGVVEEETPVFVEETSKVLAVLYYATYGDWKVKEYLGVKDGEYHLVTLANKSKDIERGIKFISGHLPELEKRINNLSNDIEYGHPNENIPEIIDEFTMEEVHANVRDNIDSSTPDIVKDIIKRCHYWQRLSLKQGQIIRRHHKKLLDDGRVATKDDFTAVKAGELAKIVVSITMDKKYVTVIDLDSAGNVIEGNIFEVGVTKAEDGKYSKIEECIIFIKSGCIQILKDVGIHHSKMKITEIGRELSNKINGVGGSFVKFKDINTYVGCSDVVYDSIIKDKCVLNGIHNESYMYKTALMMSFANNKLSK